jgi:ornithine cyclodeaminase/alanine dehydrogenase-like protein (mu-crystallin family)
MLILTAEEVRKALPMRDAIEAVKSAYAALSDGRAAVPLRSRVSITSHKAMSLVMPAYVETGDGETLAESLAVKVVSLFPQNPAKGLAYIQAAVLVLEPDSGRTLALLEGSSLTAIRTGAASGAAIDVLARWDSHVVAVIGAGTQARTQLEAACTVRRIEGVFIYDSDPHKAMALAGEMAGHGPIPDAIHATANPAEAVRDADIICTATTSLLPVFEDAGIKAGTHISAVGSYTPDMQEVPAETIARARVVVDSRTACLEEAGDLIQPLHAGLFDASHIYAELGEIILGLKTGRSSAEEITYFKSVGIAVQDSVAAQVALDNAQRLQLGQEVNF